MHAMTKSKFVVLSSVDFVNEKTNIVVTVCFIFLFYPKLFDPNGGILYTKKDAKQGRFITNAPVSGTYTTCFKNGSKQAENGLCADNFKVDMFFKFKSGIEAKDYSSLAQLQNLEEVEVQTQWILDALYEVQDTVEYGCLFCVT